MRNIIGVTGRKYAGKDTFAEALGHDGWKVVAFAHPLKAMMSMLLMAAGEPPDKISQMLHGGLKEVPSPSLCGQTPRHAMQTLGTEWRDTVGTNLWTTILQRHIEAYPDDRYVISDVRFLHEADMIRSMGGVIVKIVGRGDRNAHSDHASEQEIYAITADYVVNNSGSIPDLYTRAAGIAFNVEHRTPVKVRPDMANLSNFLTGE